MSSADAVLLCQVSTIRYGANEVHDSMMLECLWNTNPAVQFSQETIKPCLHLQSLSYSAYDMVGISMTIQLALALVANSRNSKCLNISFRKYIVLRAQSLKC